MSDEEVVAWVDESENFIEAVPLSVANSNPKYLHQEIAIFVYDQNRRVLLQQRSDTKKIKPGIWTVTAAGHVTYGDTLEETVKKELMEEMGISIGKPIYLFREHVLLPNESHYCHWFSGLYCGGKVVIDPKEVKDFRWISPEEFSDFKSREIVSDRTAKIIISFWENKLSNNMTNEN